MSFNLVVCGHIPDALLEAFFMILINAYVADIRKDLEKRTIYVCKLSDKLWHHVTCCMQIVLEYVIHVCYNIQYTTCNNMLWKPANLFRFISVDIIISDDYCKKWEQSYTL